MIRNARLEDVPTLVEIGRVMHAEGQYAAYNFDEAKLRREIDALIELDQGIALVSEENGHVVGGFIGMVHEHFFGHDKVSYDQALFLLPQHRSGFQGMKLIKEYISQAKDKGAAQITIANSTGFEMDKVASLYERLGFEHVGYVFTMRAVQ